MANIIKINGKDIKDVKATQDIADLKSQIDLMFDDETGRIYITINGVKKGNGAQIVEPDVAT